MSSLFVGDQASDFLYGGQSNSHKYGDNEYVDNEYGDNEYGDNEYGNNKYGDNKYGDNEYDNDGNDFLNHDDTYSNKKLDNNSDEEYYRHDNVDVDNAAHTNKYGGSKEISIDDILGGSLFENVRSSVYGGADYSDDNHDSDASDDNHDSDASDDNHDSDASENDYDSNASDRYDRYDKYQDSSDNESHNESYNQYGGNSDDDYRSEHGGADKLNGEPHDDDARSGPLDHSKYEDRESEYSFIANDRSDNNSEYGNESEYDNKSDVDGSVRSLSMDDEGLENDIHGYDNTYDDVHVSKYTNHNRKKVNFNDENDAYEVHSNDDADIHNNHADINNKIGGNKDDDTHSQSDNESVHSLIVGSDDEDEPLPDKNHVDYVHISKTTFVDFDQINKKNPIGYTATEIDSNVDNEKRLELIEAADAQNITKKTVYVDSKRKSELPESVKPYSESTKPNKYIKGGTTSSFSEMAQLITDKFLN